MPPSTIVDDANNLGEGDSYLVLNLLPEDEDWMEKLKQEVQFRVMLHRGGTSALGRLRGPFFCNAQFPLILQVERFLAWSQYKVR
jgi:hypothetical protein